MSSKCDWLFLVVASTVVANVSVFHVQATATGGVSWSYDRVAGANGPDEWETLNANWSCNGKKQSPIDILTDQVMQKDPTNPPNLRLTVAGNNPITGEIRNNGYAPTFYVGEELTVKLAGGLLEENYFLKQFHFHFGCNDTVGSEHTIDGNTYPIELHMVFWDNSNYATFELAAEGEAGLAVVAVLYELPMANSNETLPNSALEKISQLLNNIVEEGSSHVVTKSAGIHIEDLAPLLVSQDVADRFYKYQGSLTTPGCYESVTWFVMNNHPQITELEIQAFRALQSKKTHTTGPNAGRMCNNFRNTMSMNGRQIHSSEAARAFGVGAALGVSEMPEVSADVLAARAKLAERFNAVRTGGKGTARRTKLSKHVNNGADDKQLQAQLKRLGVNNIPGIEEVNMFKEDGEVLHFASPKVQASVGANTYVISGHAENKKLEELLPGVINQIGAENLMSLKRIAEGFSGGMEEKKDEDIPDIGENFEEVSKQ